MKSTTRKSTILGIVPAGDLPDAVYNGLINCNMNKPGIIGIQIPSFPGTVEMYEFMEHITECSKETSTDVVIITEPKSEWFHHKNKIQMEALAGRVIRDRNDGIRYNRLFIALYRSLNPVPEAVKLEHDYFITIEDKGIRKQTTTLQINENNKAI